MKYIVRLTSVINYHTEFLGNGTYYVNGNKYAAVVGNDIKDAKRYSTYDRAEKAFQKLSESCVNVSLCKCEIIGIEE